jgi:hypothetical protein
MGGLELGPVQPINYHSKCWPEPGSRSSQVLLHQAREKLWQAHIQLARVCTSSFIYFVFLNKRFAMDSPRSVILVFSQSYVKHDLRKNKFVVPFFCQQIYFYELIVRF